MKTLYFGYVHECVGIFGLCKNTRCIWVYMKQKKTKTRSSKSYIRESTLEIFNPVSYSFIWGRSSLIQYTLKTIPLGTLVWLFLIRRRIQQPVRLRTDREIVGLRSINPRSGCSSVTYLPNNWWRFIFVPRSKEFEEETRRGSPVSGIFTSTKV